MLTHPLLGLARRIDLRRADEPEVRTGEKQHR